MFLPAYPDVDVTYLALSAPRHMLLGNLVLVTLLQFLDLIQPASTPTPAYTNFHTYMAIHSTGSERGRARPGPEVVSSLYGIRPDSVHKECGWAALEVVFHILSSQNAKAKCYPSSLCPRIVTICYCLRDPHVISGQNTPSTHNLDNRDTTQ